MKVAIAQDISSVPTRPGFFLKKLSIWKILACKRTVWTGDSHFITLTSLSQAFDASSSCKRATVGRFLVGLRDAGDASIWYFAEKFSRKISVT